ncbi:uncharacterized protein LOC118436308 [Folsomia candida]|nr:uncharacterized protein LOC118436308 [Folsomia candida]
MGVNGPLKLFSDILSLQDEDVVDVVFFNGHDLQHISTLVRAIQEIMGSDETTDEQLTLNIRRLRALVEQKLDQISIQERITFVSPSVLEVGVDFITQSMADINLTLANARYSELTTNSPTTTSTSSTKSATSRPEGVKMSILSRSKVMLWPLDRLLKWIGCSKRMASSTVSPASVRDVKYLEDTN